MSFLNKFLVFRKDSLLVSTTVGAIIYYAPPFVAAMGAAAAYAKFTNNHIKNTTLAKPEESLNTWLANHNLTAEKVNVQKGSTWYVNLK